MKFQKQALTIFTLLFTLALAANGVLAQDSGTTQAAPGNGPALWIMLVGIGAVGIIWWISSAQDTPDDNSSE